MRVSGEVMIANAPVIDGLDRRHATYIDEKSGNRSDTDTSHDTSQRRDELMEPVETIGTPKKVQRGTFIKGVAAATVTAAVAGVTTDVAQDRKSVV